MGCRAVFNPLQGTQGTLVTAYHLTARECEVLTYIAQGLSNKAIAETLCIAYDTANQHVKNIYRKLAVSNRVEATILYLQIKSAVENHPNR